MTQGDFYDDSQTGVQSSNEWIPDLSVLGTGAVELHSFGGDSGSRVVKEIDVDGDGNYEVTIELVDVSGQFHSQNNKVLIKAENMQIRFINTGNSASDYHVAGMEVSD